MEDKNIKDKMIGKTKEVVGRVQKAVGDLTDNATLRAKGKKTEAQGKAQGKPVGFFEKVKDTVSNVVSTVNYKIEEITHTDKTDNKTTPK